MEGVLQNPECIKEAPVYIKESDFWYFPSQKITVNFGCDGGDEFSIYAEHDDMKDYLYHVCNSHGWDDKQVPDVDGYTLAGMIIADLKAGRAAIETRVGKGCWEFRTWSATGDVHARFIMHPALQSY